MNPFGTIQKSFSLIPEKILKLIVDSLLLSDK